MNLFAGTIDYHCRYRPGIPSDVARILDEATPRRSTRRLLDIGTGTGLTDRFDDIIGIDTDADMLVAAEQTVRVRVLDGTRLRRRSRRPRRSPRHRDGWPTS